MSKGFFVLNSWADETYESVSYISFDALHFPYL